MLNPVSVFIVSKTLLGVQSAEVFRDTLGEPQIGPVLHGDEAAEELFRNGLRHGFPGDVGLVDDGDGVQYVGAHNGHCGVGRDVLLNLQKINNFFFNLIPFLTVLFVNLLLSTNCSILSTCW